MSRYDLELFRLEDRVLFEAAAVAEIVDAAEAAQDNPNANVNEAEKQAQDERDTLKNAPPGNPADQAEQSEGDAQRDPAEAADVDAQVEQLIQGEIPVTDGDVDVTVPELVDSSHLISAEGDADLVDVLIVPSDATISSGRELVVINGTVPDQAAILAALKPNQEVLVLEDGNGLTELNEYLDAHEGKYDAIHLVTHGNEGYIFINSEKIDAANFNSVEWKAVGEHLTEDGDILLYGCNTAETPDGKLLVDKIAEASGADVAASVDITGIGGDWELEYASGTVETSEISVVGFDYRLTDHNVTSNADSGDNTLRWALEEAQDGDSISFTLGSDNTITLSSSLIIAESRFNQQGLTIDGSNTNGDNVILDGGNTVTQNDDGTLTYGTNGVQILNISSDNIVELHYLTLQNGYMDGDGGAICNSGKLDISAVYFDRNLANGNGGAIFNRGVLTGHSIYRYNAANDDGGAIYNIGSLDFSFAAFFENVSTHGGAIYSNGSLTLLSSEFSFNTALSGGAIYATEAIKIDDGKFYGNSSEVHGGAILITNCNGTEITNSLFEYNSTAQDAAGGAIWGLSASVVVRNSLFRDNTANYGGAIALSNGDLTVVDSNFSANSAKDVDASNSGYDYGAKLGGAIYIAGILNITGSIFEYNSALGVSNNSNAGGGALYIEKGSVLEVSESRFFQNSSNCSSYTEMGGGAICNNGEADIFSCTFMENNTDSSGGAVWNGGALNLANSTFLGNSTTYNGGAIFNTKQLTVVNSTFTYNKAGLQAGAIDNDEGTTTVVNSIVTGNTNWHDYYDDISGNITAYYSVIGGINQGTISGKHNTSGMVAGLIYGDYGPASEVNWWNNVEQTYFKVLESEFSSAGTLVGTFLDSDGRLSFAFRDGGIWISLKDGNTIVTESVTAITSDQLGNSRLDREAQDLYTIGAVNSRNDLGPLEERSLVVTTSEDVWDLTDGKISLREALAYAGIGVTDNAGGKTISFDFETSASSITMSVMGPFQVVMKEDTLSTPLIIDGDLPSGSLTIDAERKSEIFAIGYNNNVFLDNLILKNGYSLFESGYSHILSSAGGAIYNMGILTISNCIFQNNSTNIYSSWSSAYAGGAIYNDAGFLSISDCDFNGNKSSVASILYNASSGGAIFNRDGELKINGSLFETNSATGSAPSNSSFLGGAIVYFSGTQVISNSTFKGNVTNGSSNFIVDGTLCGNSGHSYILNSTFTGNSSDAVTSYLSTISVVNSILVGNGGMDISGSDYSSFSLYHSLVGNIWDDNKVTLTDTVTGVSPQDVFLRIDASGNAIADADGLFSICPQGLAGTRGVFIWHNDDYSAITYSTTLYGPQTAIVGNVDSAVTCITLDQRGTDRTSRITPGVGAVATSAEQSSLIVTTGLDQSNPYDGLTSLREALAYAATLGGTPEITFDIPGNDTVILNSALDTIDSSLTIDGYNQATENDVTISVESQGVIQNNSGEWEVNPAGSQFRVFSIANETPEIILVKLSNLSIIGGNISAGGESRDGYGACIWAVGSGAIQLSLDHVELRQGYAYAGGGLHYCSPSNLEIKNSTFINNFATFGGGILIGVQNSIGDMNVQVTESLFLGNYSESNGGAIRAGSCNLTVERSEFEQTRSTSSVILLGGTSGEYLITDSLFHNNVDEAITQRYDTTTVNLRNVTLAKNGGSAKLLNGSLLNSILWGNNEKDLVVTDKVTVAYNAIEGWNKGGPGNITLQSENNGTDAPGVYYANFVDPTSGDYRLVANSYLINRGDNSAISAGAMDLAKDSRLQYGYVDIGAYETAGKGNIVIDFTAPETLIYGDSASISASHDGRDSGTIAYESANTEAVLVAGTTITAVKASESSVLSATVAASANWNNASATRTVTTQKRSITVTADAQTKVYGEADPQLTYQVTGLVGDDTLAGSLEREAGEDVGEYAITQGTLANSNYNINFSGAVLTITAKEITIDLADPNFHYAIDSKVYDGNTTVTGAELSVVIGGETVALIWTDGQFNSKDVVSVTDATFTGLTSANSNYVLSADRVTVDAAGKITAKDITVTADAQTKVYGSADPELTYQVDGLIGNDTLAGSLTRAVGEDVGEYAILQGTLANSNYKINFTGANLTITAKSDVVVKPSGLNFDQYSEAVNPNFSALHPALTGRGLASVGLFSRLNENVYAMNHSALHAHLELRNGLRGSINNETASGRAVLPIDHFMMTIDAPLKNHSGFLFSRTMVMKLEALANGKEIMIDSSFAELRHMENTSAEKTHSSWHFLPESVKLPRSFFIDDVPADELPDPAYDLRGIRAELPRRADAFKSELELLLEELVGA